MKYGSFFKRCWRQAAKDMEQGLPNAATGQKMLRHFLPVLAGDMRIHSIV
ncbi:hypothetical protein [Veronia pacifica]|nr:hypothetical protein [Veronia pacifica]